MCAERMQRVLMAIVLGVILYFFGMGMMQVAVVLQTLVIVMILVWAVTNFCPSLWIFKKIFPPCKWEC
jgi:lipopolysaccharide export LptBFGC system permease protein LptF